MRNFIDATSRLHEARKTKTKSRYDLMPDLQAGSTALSPMAAGDVMPPPGERPRQGVPGKAATQRAKITPPAGSHPQMRQWMNDLDHSGMQDHMGDDEAARHHGSLGVDDPARLGHEAPPTLALPNPEQATTENLPTVINQQIARAGDLHVDPEWHQVKHLPGYMKSAIRAMGRQVFSQFTDTPIEDIQMISTLTNPTHDVQGVMAWIRDHGMRDDSAHLDFDRIMPGYKADAHLWTVEDYSFLLVSDMGGKYIYGWAGGRGSKLDGPGKPKRLGGR